ncbi:MAG: M1 family metallopeptidase [Acidimicrobiia bacterium]
MIVDNPYRLPRTVVPSRYDVELAPDLAAATFSGCVRIDVDIVEATAELVLNAAELEIRSALLQLADGTTPATTHELDEATERMIIRSDRELLPGRALLTIEFDGVLNDRLRGFYRSTFTDDDGEEQVIAASQMQATDCRKAFPCWDEPAFKAVFGATLVVDAGLLAISNSPEVAREGRPGPKVAIRYADTMVMSSYLVAFVVGRLEATEPVDVGGIPLRLVHVPGKGHLAAFGLDVGAFALRWFQEYYGIPYPGEKVDLVALPDFAAGAMENLGCITFRESLLLVDPDTSTQAEQELVADVVSHELAHMWFGDLVTMSWWNGIWLNEAFATFMEVAACEAYRPDWRRWTSFSLERTTAFETDSLANTRSVEYEVRSPTDTEGMFDVLTYQKGGSLLRMLQQFIGEEPFRAGINHYLRTHSYANTETGDLWDAIEHVTGQPARRLMDSWIWQPGYPIVSAHVDGTELVLRQQRFGFDDETASDPSRWVIPVHISQRADASADASAALERKVLLDGDELRVPLLSPDATVIVNAGGHGFFRVSYDDTLRSRLTDKVVASMSTVERYMLVDDTWAAVVSGRLAAGAFLELARSFSGERELQVWQALANGLRSCSRLLEGDALTSYRAVLREIVAPSLGRLGWEPADGEDDLTGQLRGLLVGLSAVLGEDADSQQRARQLFERAQAGATVDPELLAAATSVVASTGTVEDYEHFIERFRHGATPQEQLRHLYALAEFDDAALMQRTCDFAFSGEVKSQNAPFLLGRCIANRDHGPLAWRRVRERWADAVATFPSNTIIRMIDSVKLLNRPEQEADIQGFFAEHDIPQSAKTLQQVLERQRVNVALRTREEARLASDIDRLLGR